MIDRRSNEVWLTELEALVKTERKHTAKLLRHMGEVDAREAYRERGYPSMYVYCEVHLRMDVGIIYNRIYAARASRRFPVLLELVADGEVNLTAIRLLAPHLTAENHVELVDLARGRTKLDIEVSLAARFPQAERRTSIRKVAEAPVVETVVEKAPEIRVVALAPDLMIHHISLPRSAPGSGRAGAKGVAGS